MQSHSASSTLEDELNEVHDTLQSAVDALGSPLGDIVRAQAKRAYPLVRAAVVLASAISAQRDDDLRRRRISLAAALEMLHIALNVHRLLVGAAYNRHPGDRDGVLDRSFVGSTILSGDYCFSRAAQFAAATDNPRVVAHFAQTLQIVSEGQLRHQFDHNGDNGHPDYDETNELLRSGVLAAAALADLTSEETNSLVDLSQEVAHRLSLHAPVTFTDANLPATLSPERLARWRALPLLLSTQPKNGKIAASSPPLR